MSQLFLFLYHYFRKRVGLFIGLLLSFVAISAFLASKLTFEEDISRLMPTDERVKQINLIFQHAKFADKLILHISQLDSTSEAHPDQLLAYAQTLSPILKARFEPHLIAHIRDQVSDEQMIGLYDFFYQNLPIFLEDEDYEEIEQLITEEKLSTNFQRNFKFLLSPASAILKRQILQDPVGISPLALRKLQALQIDENFDLYQGHILTKDRRHLLMFISPTHGSSETAKNGALLSGIDALIDSLAQDSSFREVHAEYYGGTAVAVGNARQIKGDVALTVSLAILFIFLLVGLFFRQLQVFIFIALPVIFGSCLALAAIYLLRQEISVISLGIGAVLIGITIDYALHIFTHYRATGDVEEVIKDVSAPLLTSCLTTAAAFLCLLMLSVTAMNDLGIFAAFGVMGAAVFSLIVLPHLLPLSKLRPEKIKRNWLDRLAAYPFDQNRPLVVGIILITIVCLFSARHASFDGDLMKMNFLPEHLALAEKRLDEISNVSRRSIYLVASGDSLEEALQYTEQLEDKLKSLQENGLIKGYVVVSKLLKSQALQQARIKQWEAFWTSEKKELLRQQLDSLSQAYNFKPEAFKAFFQLLDNAFVPLSLSDMEALRKGFLDEYIHEDADASLVVSVLKVDRKDTQAIYEELEGEQGLSILDRQYISTRFLDLLKEDFDLLVNTSLFIVFIILVHLFGRLELGIISFLPILISWFWTIGLMGLLGLSFNIFNIIISTFVFGLGIDYSIFVMRGLLQNYAQGKNNLHIYKSSILLSAFTTLAGIGVLIFAKHPALFSISLLSIIGISSVVLITYTLQPLMFRWLIMHEGRKRTLPITLPDLVVAMLIFIIFLIGSMLLTVVGILCFKLTSGGKESKKHFYHRLISWLSKAIVYSSFHIRKKVINPQAEDFSRPAIIISNHQSHIDLVLLLMLHPKMIVLTNDWVWNNSFYGKIVKFADFYPVSEGFEEGLGKFRERVAAGYSILVFPEGTRSADGRIKRFHKGAFLLAEQLNLDILPILLHGANDCMPKGEPFLRSGHVRINILPRINREDISFGETYQIRSKQIGRYMREEFARMKGTYQTPAYYKQRLIKNYIYKGPVIEWYFRLKIRLENNYAPFDELLPKEGHITDLGCGYGFMAYMLSFLSEKRTILGIDYDREKIDIANHCLAKTDRTHFLCGDVSNFPLEKSDAFVLSDVLHYLTTAQQQQLIANCIEQLNPQGCVIIRDGNKEMKARHRGTKMTEFFSTNFGFNKTHHPLVYLSQSDIQKAISDYPVKMEVIDNTKLTSNLMYVIRYKKT